MIITLDFESKEAIYTQIIHQVVIGIAKGALQPNDPLPSVRSLATDVGVNVHTVNKAYQQLKQEGYILIHRQKGVVVHPEGVEKADSVYMEKLKQTLTPVMAEAVCREVTEEELITLCKEVVTNFKK